LSERVFRSDSQKENKTEKNESQKGIIGDQQSQKIEISRKQSSVFLQFL
jgi:hypothetical protein